MSRRSDAAGIHFFSGSSNLQFNGNPQFYATINRPAGTQAFEHLRHLDSEVATNAILNAGGRVDIPKCHPGTRKEVIAKAERWMSVGYREDRRIFWLSGPAGAGKSAIVQTLSERCIERRALMANFFFFRGDGSRNHSRAVIATLLYQLLELLPGLLPHINEIISWNRLVFRKPLRDQFKLLIDDPIRKLRQETPDATPIILFIDGLDECDSRTDLHPATKSEQTSLLQTLHEIVTSGESQFIALVASRAESHIQMAFNRTGCTPESVYLDRHYHPDKDIRHYVETELANIGRAHPLAGYLDASWPAESIVDAIVEKSSGQFIYAATL